MLWEKVYSVTLAAWLSLATICILGAMSPGPSLVVVLKNTMAGGRSEGVKTALAHGFGVGLYAFATAASLAAVLIKNPLAFKAIQWIGALFLAYLGLKTLLGTNGITEASQTETDVSYNGNGLRSGFLTAFLNPKLAIFFAALFSQFVSPLAQFGEKILMALTAAFIDSIWYLFVVLVLSNSRLLNILRNKAGQLDNMFGFLLILLAVRVITLS